VEARVFVKASIPIMIIVSLMASPSAAQTPFVKQTPPAITTSSDIRNEKTITYAASPRKQLSTTAVTTEDILLIQTSDPWESSDHYVGNNWYDGITADTLVLDSLGYTYRIATWDNINQGTVNIFAYPVILIVNDQVQAFYDSYAAHVTDFENYVSSGHTLVFFAASDGWAGGRLNANLPGGVHVVTPWYEYNNYIVDSSHPIVSGQLSGGDILMNADLYSYYCSHGYFTSLPANATTILEESHNYPTLVEYRLGNGRVIASTQTWEHNWAYHTGSDGYGTFARRALDDVFLYAFSGGTVPSDVKLDLRIEDAPAWISVNKSRSSYMDVVARVSGGSSYGLNVVLQIPSDKFGVPVKTFTRNRPGDPNFGQNNQYINLGTGQYQISTTLQALGGRYYKELVWRFLIPSGVTPERDVTLSARVSVPGYTVQTSNGTVKVNIIDNANSLIVTNRRLLFSKYQANPDQNDVSSLLETVYEQAWVFDGEVFYVDLYDNGARDWAQNVDYSNETAANTIATAIHGLMISWYNRLTKHPSIFETIKPQYLLLVGGDEIIPFYRADDRPYGDLEFNDVHIDDSDPVGKVPQQHYLLSDNIYSSISTDKSQWEEGKLNLSTGRIIGYSAASMRQFIENATFATPALSQAVVASRSSIHKLDTVIDRLNSRHVAIYSQSNPDLTENDTWTRAQWITALQQPYQVLAYQGHGAYDGWYGTSNWTSGVTASDQPSGLINENHPLFAVEACNFAIPTDLHGAAWLPDPNDNISWKLISLGAGGILGSMGIDTTSPKMAYGTRLHNDYFRYLIDKSSWFGLIPASDYSEDFGTALLKAKQNYPGNGFPWGYDSTDKKTLMEYVYYGLPWSFMPTPDNNATDLLAASKTPSGYNISEAVPTNNKSASYNVVITSTISSYQFTPITGFEMLEIPGADTLYSSGKPVLPLQNTTINLPSGATVFGVNLITSHSIPLGQHNIPAAYPSTSYNSTNGYTSTMGVTGVFPSVLFTYTVRTIEDHSELRIIIAPATFNVGTHDVALFDSITLQASYTATMPVVLDNMSTDQPEYQVGETITPRANIKNVGSNPMSLVSRVRVFDAGASSVLTMTSAAYVVDAGGDFRFQLPFTPTLAPGNYQLSLSVEQSGMTLVSEVTSFRVLAGRLSWFNAPQSVVYGEYGTFNLSFTNYLAVPVTATAKVHIYDASGTELADLLQRTFVVSPHEIGATSWSWEPTGLTSGTYTVRAAVNVGDDTYTSNSVEMQVKEPAKVYLPIMLLNHSNAIPYQWLDATTGGTIVAQSDDTYEYLNLPFTFNFYGNAYSGVYVSSNGFVSFGAGYSAFSNTCIPSVSTPNNAIYGLWEDLVPTGGANGNVYVKQVDTNTFVIEWYQVKHYGTSDYETFEIVIHNDSSITLQYQTVVNVSSTTVGVENDSGTLAKQYYCNGNGTPVVNQQVIQYTTP